MIKVALIDDGVRRRYAKRYSNVNVTYTEVGKDNTVSVQVFEPFRRSINHATICFSLYLNTIKQIEFELISISVIDNKRREGEINRLITALEWCLENNVKLISLSIGSTYYKDFHRLDAVLKQLYSENIIVVAAFANNNKLTYPAASPYVIGVRIDTTKNIPAGEYIVLEKALTDCEVILSSDFTDNVTDNLPNIPMEFNSFATPIIAALAHEGITKGRDSRDDVMAYLKSGASRNRLDLWDLRKNNHTQFDIDIPVLALPSKSKNSHELLVKLFTLFDEEDYLVYILYDNDVKPLEQSISITRLLMNSNESYTNALAFTQYYTNAELLVLYIDSSDIISKLVEAEIIDIVIADQAFDSLECQTILYGSTSNDTVETMKNQIIRLLGDS